MYNTTHWFRGTPTLGGLLTEVARVSMSVPLHQEYEFVFSPDWRGHQEVLEDILGSLEIRVNLRWDDESSVRHQRISAESSPLYSLSRINHLHELSGGQAFPKIPWNRALEERVKVKLGMGFGQIATIHSRSSDSSDPFVDSFVEAITSSASSFESLFPNIVLLGNQYSEKLRVNLSALRASDDCEMTISEQLFLAENSRMFVAIASGFASSAIFSSAKYAIFKDPAQHADTVDRDIGPNGQILFAQKGQYFLRRLPSKQEVEEILRAEFAV